MTPCWLLVLLCSPLWPTEGVEGWGGLSTVPSESECRPYIEKALKELSPETPQEAVDATGSEQDIPPSQSADQEGSIEETEEATTKESIEGDTVTEAQVGDEAESTETGETTETESSEAAREDTAESEETLLADAPKESVESIETEENVVEEIPEDTQAAKSSDSEELKDEAAADQQTSEDISQSTETSHKVDETDHTITEDQQSSETPDDSTNEVGSQEEETKDSEKNEEGSGEQGEISKENDKLTDETKPEDTSKENTSDKDDSAQEKPDETQEEITDSAEKSNETSTEDQTAEDSIEITGGEVTDSSETDDPLESKELKEDSESKAVTESKEATESKEGTESNEATESKEATESTEPPESIETQESKEATESTETTESKEVTESAEKSESVEAESDEKLKESEENTTETKETSVEKETEDKKEESTEDETKSEDTSGAMESSHEVSTEGSAVSGEEVSGEETSKTIEATPAIGDNKESEDEVLSGSTEVSTEQEPAVEEPVKEQEPTVEDQLTLEFETPKVRRAREHIAEILHLSPESAETELLLAKTIETTLKDLKKLYDSAIKPLEILYKYRDLSNRHFGDPEIFSKPLILFMGPWSGGKSTILNYLLDNEFKSSSLRTGAEPSPAYFNILMWGEREEVLDGTQLAADWTFSGLQKFGQGLLDRLRGLRLNSPLLEKVNIVEIPGILEIRKQVERLFPFNDACQWFIDRADIIFLVYDPSKLDVGPETEAILDQLKGREYQTRIILNKADQVKPEELMRVQGTLIWNISPLMCSQEPPVMYSTSLWSIPYEQGAPSRLLHAQERAFLRDLRQAVDKRVENKIASARRFAVRVRNHAKMVDCYLTTYYNHKTFFGNRKKVADDIIEHPQNYHIYEGLSTLTNISRYDLPDPEVYRDFFRLNPVYDFQRLSDTCTYFRGCPINRLDVAIAYELPELVGKYKKHAEKVLEAAEKETTKS